MIQIYTFLACCLYFLLSHGSWGENVFLLTFSAPWLSFLCVCVCLSLHLVFHPYHCRRGAVSSQLSEIQYCFCVCVCLWVFIVVLKTSFSVFFLTCLPSFHSMLPRHLFPSLACLLKWYTMCLCVIAPPLCDVTSLKSSVLFSHLRVSTSIFHYDSVSKCVWSDRWNYIHRAAVFSLVLHVLDLWHCCIAYGGLCMQYSFVWIHLHGVY